MDKNWYHKSIELFRFSNMTNENIHALNVYVNIGKFIGIGVQLTLNLFSGAIEFKLQVLCININGHIWLRNPYKQ